MIVDTDNISVMQALALVISKRASKRRARNRSYTWVVTAVRLLLHIGGLGCLTAAGFLWTMQAGLITGGVSLFVLSWLATSGTTNESPQETNDIR